MAKYDQGGGCACGLQLVCDCDLSKPKPNPTLSPRQIFEQEVVPLFEWHSGEWLAKAREVAFTIAERRGTVTINDVRKICPPPADVDPRVMGAVFMSRVFKRVGYIDSNRATCHGRPIGIFGLR